MATIINADTSDGLKLTSDTSGQLELQSAGSTKVTMDTSGNVGIGTASPTSNLDVVNSSASGTGAVTTIRLNHPGTTAGDGPRLLFTSGSSTTGGCAIAGTGQAVNSANMVFYAGGNTERMRIDSSGNVFINTTSNAGTAPAYINTVFNGVSHFGASIKTSYGSAGSTFMQFVNSSGAAQGSIYANATTTTSYNTSSDYRLKENVAPMSGSIDRLKQLKPSTWAWIQDGSHGEGFLAHEAQEIVPECATGTKDAMRTEEYEVTPAVKATYDEEDNELTPAVEAVMGTREVPDYQGIDQSKLVPLLTAALQEAITKIEDLETRIQALENA